MNNQPIDTTIEIDVRLPLLLEVQRQATVANQPIRSFFSEKVNGFLEEASRPAPEESAKEEDAS